MRLIHKALQRPHCARSVHWFRTHPLRVFVETSKALSPLRKHIISNKKNTKIPHLEPGFFFASSRTPHLKKSSSQKTSRRKSPFCKSSTAAWNLPSLFPTKMGVSGMPSHGFCLLPCSHFHLFGPWETHSEGEEKTRIFYSWDIHHVYSCLAALWKRLFSDFVTNNLSSPPASGSDGPIMPIKLGSPDPLMVVFLIRKKYRKSSWLTAKNTIFFLLATSETCSRWFAGELLNSKLLTIWCLMFLFQDFFQLTIQNTL